ncbi:unnamed protein product [Brassicogethes aeneus]|uniref:Uncharacterized protein n=1 Tax=Brassicogethes aeneus TaxID=1431903 RepID=A0A9P0BGN1_BRAAE|nr:unnamed protein product [Brassicogethes aeneus]
MASAIGLNIKLRTSNSSYESAADKPMISTKCTEFDEDSYLNKLYLEDTYCSMGIPRSNSNYLCIFENLDTAPAVSNKSIKYPVHANGPPALEKYLKRYHVTSHIGQTILDYNYEPTYAPITKTACLDINNGADVIYLENRDVGVLSRGVQQRDDGGCDMSASTKSMTATYTTGFTQKYSQPLEKPYYIRPGSSANTKKTQPQVHLGLLPTPKINPATKTTDIQNSSLYYEVVFTMETESRIDSLYPNSNCVHGPWDEATFIANKHVVYKGGAPTLLGFNDRGLSA